MNAASCRDTPANDEPWDGGASTAVSSSGSTAGGITVIACAPRWPLQHGQRARKLSVGERFLHEQRVHVSPQECSAARSMHVAATLARAACRWR